MTRPLIYLEFKGTQIPYVNGFDVDTILKYLLIQDDQRGYYGLYGDFDNVFKKTTTLPHNEPFYYPVIISKWSTHEIMSKIDVPMPVIDAIKSNMSKILLVCPFEGWEWQYWENISSTIKIKYDLDDSHFVILSGNYYPESKHNSVVFNYWEGMTAEYPINPEMFLLGLEKLSIIRKNKFICLNRRPSPIRCAVVTELYDYKDQGILTFAKSAGYDDGYVNHQYYVFSEKFPELVDNFKEKIIPNIPLKYDDGIDPEIQNPAQDDVQDKFYDSYLYIVTETIFYEKETLFLSEKIFKPMKFLQPFVVIGRPGTLRLLKELGYKTFDKFWDESYDEEFDDKLRLYKAMNIAKSIIKKSPEELTELMIEMKEILEHNFNTLQYRANIQFDNLRKDLYITLVEKNGVLRKDI